MLNGEEKDCGNPRQLHAFDCLLATSCLGTRIQLLYQNDELGRINLRSLKEKGKALQN